MKDRDFFDVVFLINFAKPYFTFLREKCGIQTPEKLQSALIAAADQKKLTDRKSFDCEHMLFNKKYIGLIRSFSDYIENFDFSRFNEVTQ